jgi:hypothetical protein
MIESNEPQTKRLKLESCCEPNTCISFATTSTTTVTTTPVVSAVENGIAASAFRANKINVMLTNAEDTDRLRDIVLKLGGNLVNTPSECTHLIAGRVARTLKFMCAFNVAEHVLNSSWLIKSVECGYFVEERTFQLQDSSRELEFGFSLTNSLNERKLRQKPIFNEMLFFITRSCVPSVRLLLQMIESAGGKATYKKPPTQGQLEAIIRVRNINLLK